MSISDSYYIYNTLHNTQHPKLEEQNPHFGLASVIERCAKIFAQALSELPSITQGLKHFTARQHYHFSRTSATLGAHMLFGKDLLVPAVNSIREEFLDAVFEEEIVKNPQDRNECSLLKEHGFFLGGFCLALSCQFICEVHKAQAQGTSLTPEAMRSIGEKFIDGGPEETAENQRTQLSTHLHKENVSLNKVIINEAIQEANNIVNKSKKIETNSALYEDSQLLTRTEIEKELKINSKNAKILHGPEIKTNHGLNSIAVDRSTISKNNPTDQSSEEQYLSLTEFTADKLPPGEYVIYSSNGKDPSARGHAIAYIRCASGPDYLYDPNLGTVQIPAGKDVEYISHCSKVVGHDQLYLTRYKSGTY